MKQLELLLTRQKDIELFEGARLDYLVFDEAHTFRGTLGAETACLIRRLRAFCGRSPDETVCIGTSATLVDPNDEESRTAGREFAARFFGVDETRVRLVGEQYQAEDVWSETRVLPAPVGDAAGSASDSAGSRRAGKSRPAFAGNLRGPNRREILMPLDGASSCTTASQVTNCCGKSSSIWAVLVNSQTLTRAVSETIARPLVEEEVLLWLALGAAARKEDRPLVRPVIHTFVRGMGGAVVAYPTGATEPALSLSADHVAPDPQLGDKPPKPLPVLTCTTCGQHYFEHHAQDFTSENSGLKGGNPISAGGRWWEPKDAEHGGQRLLMVDGLISDLRCHRPADDDRDLDGLRLDQRRGRGEARVPGRR